MTPDAPYADRLRSLTPIIPDTRNDRRCPLTLCATPAPPFGEQYTLAASTPERRWPVSLRCPAASMASRRTKLAPCEATSTDPSLHTSTALHRAPILKVLPSTRPAAST